ncbi:hypothetical protein N0B44_15705 [Roseibacterium beibuensis]|uniref:Uncharacterized protein n=1 Tax=[Roseibacterium] beibuensis TaxID=1193142 RepID=A0ABP9LB78_9RHOB|nr:hypothetical protein [Roseibacterium beibuensis]MCS6624364.1 hypothetical protein [Roseibacterium beibuensis]
MSESAFIEARIARIALTRFEANGEWPATIRTEITLAVRQRGFPANTPPKEFPISMHIPVIDASEPLPQIETRAADTLRSTLRFLAEEI